MEKKLCSKCGIEKLKTDYYSNRRNKDKVQSQCKSCMNEYSKTYRVNNPDKTRYKKRTTEDTFINFRSFTPNDIKKIPLMLEKMGYDTTKDIHKQFIDRVNKKYGLNLKTKSKPKDNFSKYFPEK
jgi:ClpP class serine protease